MEGGDWLDESIKKFAQVIQEYEGGNEQIEDIAAHAYARMGLIEDVFNHEPQKAIANYKEAAELTSPFYRGEYNGRLGDLYSATCELDLAADAYKAALQAAEVNGDGEKYTEYGEKLSALSAIDLCGSE